MPNDNIRILDVMGTPIKIGSRVLVTKSLHLCMTNWGNTWVSSMNKTVGKTYKVMDLRIIGEFQTVKLNVGFNKGYFYPSFVLLVVNGELIKGIAPY